MKKSETSPLAAAAPSPLSASVETLAAGSSTLHTEFKKQAVRAARISELEGEKATLLAAVESESVNFAEGSTKLVGINSELDLLRHGLDRRAAALAGEFQDVRESAIRLKTELVEAVAGTQRVLIAGRQKEARQWLADWNGVGPKDDAFPLPISVLLASCPVLAQLEQFRQEADAWGSQRPVADLLATARNTAACLEKLGLTPEHPSEAAEDSLGDPSVLVGWSPGRKGFDVIAIHDQHHVATENLTSLEAGSAMGGYRRIVKMRASNQTLRFMNTSNALVGSLAQDRNEWRDRKYDENDFLSTAAAWLQPSA